MLAFLNAKLKGQPEALNLFLAEISHTDGATMVHEPPLPLVSAACPMYGCGQLTKPGDSAQNPSNPNLAPCLHRRDGLCRSSNPAAWEAVVMGKHRIKPNYRRRVLRLPDLDHCKLAVLNSLGSPASRRVYEYAIDQFIAWYCSDRLASPSTASSESAIACTSSQEVWPRTRLLREHRVSE